ncbi:hypothetical protein GCM10010358_72610 [Streptomyces minutiscleroticus]|uniref:Uncharacterized protein n=1 Tax=Streptomyces minutiscleroticus TaxID=68238 RepID=A0A918U8G5_9ACTN|nr:hypothetical protein GCM10010358_72610 [Streptomyces minutiscleroticus]
MAWTAPTAPTRESPDAEVGVRLAGAVRRDGPRGVQGEGAVARQPRRPQPVRERLSRHRLSAFV